MDRVVAIVVGILIGLALLTCLSVVLDAEPIKLQPVQLDMGTFWRAMQVAESDSVEGFWHRLINYDLSYFKLPSDSLSSVVFIVRNFARREYQGFFGIWLVDTKGALKDEGPEATKDLRFFYCKLPPGSWGYIEFKIAFTPIEYMITFHPGFKYPHKVAPPKVKGSF